MKFHSSFYGCQLTEQTRNSISNDQREITPKISKAELLFLCMTHHLIVLYNSMKFYLNIFIGCQLTKWTRKRIANDQREIAPKISKVELWFPCITHCLIVFYKCMMFQTNSFNTVFNLQNGQAIAFTYVTRGNKLKNIQAKSMLLVHDTSSQCALQMYEVSLKYL